MTRLEDQITECRSDCAHSSYGRCPADCDGAGNLRLTERQPLVVTAVVSSENVRLSAQGKCPSVLR